MASIPLLFTTLLALTPGDLRFSESDGSHQVSQRGNDRVFVYLNDGTQFCAIASKSNKIRLTMRFGTFSISLKEISNLEIETRTRRGRFYLRDGDSMTALLAQETIDFVTRYGRLKVPVSSLLRIVSKRRGPAAKFANVGSVRSMPDRWFDYDSKSYTWLRGTIEYSNSHRTWILTYRPDGGDMYWGRLTLVSKKKISGFKEGDIMLVEGKIDYGQRDEGGKPVYKVKAVMGPLVPKSRLKD